MTRYSVQPRDRIFVKGYGFSSFVKNMNKNTGKNISKNLSGKCSQKFFDYAKQFATDAPKTASKRAIQKTVEVTGNVSGNKIANRIMKVLKSAQQNNSEAVKNEHDKETPKERYILPEERKKIIHDLKLI